MWLLISFSIESSCDALSDFNPKTVTSGKEHQAIVFILFLASFGSGNPSSSMSTSISQK